MSRTLTVPRRTVVSVPSQRSCVSQIVPRTVAELYLPLVRNFPLPLPQSLPSTACGPFFLLTVAALAPRPDAHCDRDAPPLSVMSVVSAAARLPLGGRCLTLKVPW
jgi:hypothetical protein